MKARAENEISNLELQIKEENVKQFKYFMTLLIVLFVSCLSFSSEPPVHTITGIENTRYSAELVTLESIKTTESTQPLSPTHFDLKQDMKLEEAWNNEQDPSPSVLRVLLPEGVKYIHHQLEHHQSPTSVRLGVGSSSLIARASYPYRGQTLFTNVVFSRSSIEDNLRSIKEGSSEKWLVSRKAKAAFLFLHGGGTRTTGASVAETSFNHLSEYGIEGISLDLPFHSRGSRQIVGSIKDDILSFGAFAKKYIPPEVPVFVYGHSWGAVYADQLMRMTSDYPDTSFFHPSLKGIIIASPAVDVAPGKSPKEKIESYIKHNHEARELSKEKAPKPEQRIFEDMVFSGKLSTLGGFYTSYTLNQIDQQIPEHRGKKWIDSLMMVGQGDPLVFLGFEKFFKEYYNSLENVETHYLGMLPYIFSPDKELELTGHLLDDYQTSETNAEAVSLYLATRFIAKKLKTSAEAMIQEYKKNNAPVSNLTIISQLYANDLAFRQWLSDFKTQLVRASELEIQKEKQKISHEQTSAVNLAISHLPANRFLYILQELSRSQKSPQQDRLIQELKEIYPHVEKAGAKETVDSLLEENSSKKITLLARQALIKKFVDTDMSQVEIISKISQAFKDKNKKTLSKLLDNFPFLEKQIDNIFSIPDQVRREIFYFYEEYQRHSHPKKLTQVLRFTSTLIASYHPKIILFNILSKIMNEQLTRQSFAEFERISKNEIKKASEAIEFNSEFTSDLSKLLETIENQSNGEVAQEIRAFLSKHTVSPIQNKSYLLNDLTEEDMKSRSTLEKFRLPKEIEDQILEISQTKFDTSLWITTKNLIIDHSEINHEAQIISLLNDMIYMDTLQRAVEFLSNTSDFKAFKLSTLTQFSSSTERSSLAFEWIIKIFPVHARMKKHSSIRQLVKAFSQELPIESALLQLTASEDAKNEILEHYRNHQKSYLFFNSQHIPSVEDFSRYEEKKSPSSEDIIRYQRKIKEIEKTVQEIKKIKTQHSSVQRERSQLYVKKQNLLNKIHSFIRRINETQKQAVQTPPPSLKKEYEDLNQDFQSMKEKSESLIDALDKLALPFLEEGRLDTSELNKALSESFRSSNLQNFENQYKIWKEKYRELNHKLRTAVKNGEMGPELQEIFIDIYGPENESEILGYSLYSQLKATELQLAEMDAQIIQLNNQLSRLILEYNKNYPAPILYVAQDLNPDQVLNPPVNTTLSRSGHDKRVIDTIDHDNNLDLNACIKIWSNMKSQIPPTPP